VQNANAATEQLPDVSIFEPTGVQVNVDLELNVVSTQLNLAKVLQVNCMLMGQNTLSRIGFTSS